MLDIAHVKQFILQAKQSFKEASKYPFLHAHRYERFRVLSWSMHDKQLVADPEQVKQGD